MTDKPAGPARTGPGHHGKDPMSDTTTEDQDPQAVYARIADALGKTPDEVKAMTREEMLDATARLSFRSFGINVAHRHDHADGTHLLDEDPDEQAERVTAALERFHAHTPLFPVGSQEIHINLFGFGQAQVHYAAFDDDGKATEEYLLLSEVAEQLAVPLHKADAWARRDHDDALRAQRERDEERGTLGWECLRDLVDLGLSMIVDDPEATPDAGGERWSHAGDWLISRDRLLAFMTVSPWSREFIDNAAPLFGHAMRTTMGDKLKEIPTYRADGTPTGGTAYDDLARTDGLTVEQAAERAMRGPQLDSDTDTR